MTAIESTAVHPLIWLLGSALIAILATNLLWLAVRRGRWQPLGAIAVLPWLATSLYLLLPPLLAMQTGMISAADLGIAEIEWLRTLNVGAPLALLLVLILVTAWLVYRRSRAQGDPTTRQERFIHLLRSPFDALLYQWHWAFYRAAGAAALSGLVLWETGRLPSLLGRPFLDDPVYWGSWLGMLVAAAEWLLNPFARSSLRTPGSREIALRSAALAVATTGLFLLTRNFWLCALCHMSVEIIGAVWSPHPADAAPA